MICDDKSQSFEDALKSFKHTEQEVGKKDKKLKDIENSKNAANQRSVIDSLSRQLTDERKVCPCPVNPALYTASRASRRLAASKTMLCKLDKNA
jgi:hypothetical protein